MQERERPDAGARSGRPQGGQPGERPQTGPDEPPSGGADVRGPTRGDRSARPGGDFTDWDNPEDELEDAPEGYYDDEEPVEEFELTPDDPDYDLSDSAGYSGWEDRGRRPLLPPWLVVALSLLLILSLLAPVLLWYR